VTWDEDESGKEKEEEIIRMKTPTLLCLHFESGTIFIDYFYKWKDSESIPVP
jgi:hypothetical protein